MLAVCERQVCVVVGSFGYSIDLGSLCLPKNMHCMDCSLLIVELAQRFTLSYGL